MFVLYYYCCLKSSLYIWDDHPLSDVSYRNIFSQYLACLLILLTLTFTEHNFNFMKCNITLISFMDIPLLIYLKTFSSVQSLSCVRLFWPDELPHCRPPCPSPNPGVHSNTCLLSQWCHPAISSSVIPFCSCPQSLQHQSLFQWVNSLHEVAKLLEFQL